MENPKAISLADFCEKYAMVETPNGMEKMVLTDADRYVLNTVESWQDSGGSIFCGRKRNRGMYMASTASTARELRDGKSVVVFSENPTTFFKDLEKMFDLDLVIEPSTVNGEIQNNSHTVRLKEESE
jgi:hypothetical protein